MNPDEDVIFDDRFRACADCLLQYAWKEGDTALTDLADHAPINYITSPAAAQP